MSFTTEDARQVVERYTERFAQHGHSEASLGWSKGKWAMRFEALCSWWDFSGASVLDLGAGFGDLFGWLRDKGQRPARYLGLELTPALVEQGHARYGQEAGFELREANVLDAPLSESFDFVLICGLFNFKLANGENPAFIRQVLTKAMDHANKGVAANFLSDRVDYQTDLTWHSSPMEILELGYALTPNLALRNDYFPFEFTLFMHKNGSFDTSDTVFKTYQQGLGK